MEISELQAVVREETGKGPARRLRTKGIVPAVFYGTGAKTLPISVGSAELRALMKAKEEHVLIKLIIDDHGQKMEKLSMIKELQSEPLSRRFFHADFYEVRMDHKMTWDVPLHFRGTAAGVKNGGELLHLKRELKISCFPSALPEFIEIDISKLDIGQTIKVHDISVAEGVSVLDPSEASIVTIAAVKAAVVPEEGEEETPKTPEVIKQKPAE